MPFERPWALLALLAVPLLALLFYWAERRRRRDLSRLARQPLLRLTLFGNPRSALRSALTLAALTALSLAAAGPGRGDPLSRSRSERDILIVLDASKSMGAEDVGGSRMALAQEFAAALLSRLDGERIGIAVYAGKAVAQCPFTRDYEAAQTFLSSARPGALPYPGTDLEDAFRLAAEAFEREPKRARIVVLLTDGEDHGNDPSPLAARLKRNRIALSAVAVGTAHGALIPQYDELGSISRYLNDASGSPVVSRADPERIRELAKRAGGWSIHLDGERSFSDALDRLIRRSEEASKRGLKGGLWSAAALLAVFALAALLAEGAADRIPFR